MQLNLTLGTGDKPAQLAMLQQIALAQQQALQIGAAKPKNIYNTLSRMLKTMGYSDVSEFFTDPGDKPMQPPPNPAIQVEQMRQQADLQRFQAEMQAQQQNELLKMQADQQARQAELEVQAANDARDAEREMKKAEYDALLEQGRQENERLIASIKANVDKYRADLDSETKIIVKKMEIGQSVQADAEASQMGIGGEAGEAWDNGEMNGETDHESDGEDTVESEKPDVAAAMLQALAVIQEQSAMHAERMAQMSALDSSARMTEQTRLHERLAALQAQTQALFAEVAKPKTAEIRIEKQSDGTYVGTKTEG
jgi:hypothetical protein